MMVIDNTGCSMKKNFSWQWWQRQVSLISCQQEIEVVRITQTWNREVFLDLLKEAIWTDIVSSFKWELDQIIRGNYSSINDRLKSPLFIGFTIENIALIFWFFEPKVGETSSHVVTCYFFSFNRPFFFRSSQSVQSHYKQNPPSKTAVKKKR